MYVWAALATAAVLIFGSFWWAAFQNSAAPRRAEAAKGATPTAAAPQGRCDDGSTTGSRRGSVSPTDLAGSSQVRVEVTPASPQADKVPPAKPQTPNLGAVSVRDMFPVGSVVVGAPRLQHPYRKMPELFGSFAYGGKLWSPTGRFAHSGQVQLVPTGRRLDGRKLYALANTAGPGGALFVQSADDSDRFAIYR